MIVAAFLIILTLLAIYANKLIRKHNVKLYFLALILSVLSFIFKDHILAMPFIKGFLGLSFFYIVMITGAFKNKSKLRNKFMGIRREYSIIGFIVISPHALHYILLALDGTRALEWYGFIAFLIMIPLFVTSFLSVRKKMKLSSWKLLQKTAYVVYILLFIHLILHYSKPINLVLYLVIFVFYFVLKIIYEVNRYKTTLKKRQTSN